MLYLNDASNSELGPKRVKLDFLDFPNYDVFPGQVVAIRGRNPYGSRVIVEELFVDASLPKAYVAIDS